MDERGASNIETRRAPLHLWVIGALLVLWNGWGAALAFVAQFGDMPDTSPEATAYFDAQPLWFVLFADIGPLAGIGGAVALLLQHRIAAKLFMLQLAVIVLANAFELLAGTSFMLRQPSAAVGTLLFLLPLLAAQIIYARWLARKGVLY